MNTCPHCQSKIPRWRSLMQASKAGRFRCPGCATWLQYKLEAQGGTWLSTQMKKPAALFLVPLTLALLVVVAGTGAIIGLSRLGDTSLLILCVAFVAIAAAYDFLRASTRLSKSKLEVADLQAKQLSHASVQHLLSAIVSMETLFSALRFFAFLVQLGFYLWAIPKAIMWAVAHAA